MTTVVDWLLRLPARLIVDTESGLRRHQTVALEAWLACWALIWGLWVVQSWQAMGAVTYYLGPLGNLPESAWGGMALSYGALLLWATHRRMVRWGLILTVVGMAFWTLMSINALIIAPRSLAFPLYLWVAAGHAWCHLRLSRIRTP